MIQKKLEYICTVRLAVLLHLCFCHEKNKPCVQVLFVQGRREIHGETLDIIISILLQQIELEFLSIANKGAIMNE